MADTSDGGEIAVKLAELDPEVRKFLSGLTPDRVKYLEASIQFSRDRETAGRFMKWLAFVFALCTGAIIAFEKVGTYIGGGKP